MTTRTHPALALALLLVGTSFAGCEKSDTDAEADEIEESYQLPPLPPLHFEEATEEQLVLFDAASTAIEAGDLETAATALISLQRTGVPSRERADGTIALARIYLERADYERVAATLDVLDASAPPIADSAILRGRLFLAIDRSAEAEASFERATRIDLDGIRSLAILSAAQRSVGRTEDAAETELAMERRILRHAHALDEQPSPSRSIAILDALDAGFTNADAARAASTALAHESEEVQAHALEVLARIGTPAIVPVLARYAADGHSHSERALEIAAALGGP